jgi:hypothetical protein
MNGKLPLVLFLLTLMVFTGQAVTKLDREYFLAADPYWIMLVSRSLVTDGDIDLKDEHEFKPENVADQVALGKNGEWYPLHEWLLGAIGAPFYKAFGERGCLLLNLLIASSFSVVLYLLAAHFAPPRPAFAAAILTSLCSSIALYSYSFSIDLFGAVLGRNSNLITVPAFLLYLTLEHPKRSRLLLFLLGGAPFAAIFFLSNYLQWGSPLTVSYMRWLVWRDGALQLTPQSTNFSPDILSGVIRMLFHPEEGLLFSSPLILLALFFGGKQTLQRNPSFAVFSLLTALSLLLFFSCYSPSYPAIGNRYLLALSALSVVPLAYTFELFFEESPRKDGDA